MANTKTSIKLFVAINPYKAQGQDDEFNVLRVDAEYWKGKGFRVSYQPSWYRGGVWGCIVDFGHNPEVNGGYVDVLPANRNDQKKLQAIHDNLNTKIARDIIAYLFNVRAFGALDTAIKYMALNPSWATESELEELKKSYPALCEKKDVASENVNASESENNNNNNNSNSKTMANESNNEFRVGRVLMLKNGAAWYTILHTINSDMVQCSFEQKSGLRQEFPVKVSNLQAFIASGTYHWADEKPSEQPTASTESIKSTEPTDNDVEEVNAEDVVDAKPEPVKVKIVQPKAAEQFADEPKPKTTATTQTTATTAKTVKLNTTKTNTTKASTKASASKGAKVEFGTYKTKKGKTGGQIMGFDETDPIYLAGPELHASKSWVRKNGVRIYTLMFGPRYKDAAEAMTKAINNGATLDECRAIIEGNTEQLAKARAEQKAEYLQRKAEREAERNGNATASTKASSTKGEKLYTEAEVKARIRKAFEVLAKETGNDINDFAAFIQAA